MLGEARRTTDGMRRSVAIGGSLTRADIEQLLDVCAALLAQRDAIARILAELGPSSRETRAASTSWRVVGEWAGRTSANGTRSRPMNVAGTGSARDVQESIKVPR